MPTSPAIAAALLAYAAATDNRNVTEEAARGWAAALDERVTPADGKAAIDTHRATSTDWLMPAHVNAEVRRIRKARADAMAEVNPPADAATPLARHALRLAVPQQLARPREPRQRGRHPPRPPRTDRQPSRAPSSPRPTTTPPPSRAPPPPKTPRTPTRSPRPAWRTT